MLLSSVFPLVPIFLMQEEIAPCRLTKLRLVDLAPFISHSILMSLKAAASTSINTHRSPQGAGPYMIDTGILELRLKMIAFLTALIVTYFVARLLLNNRFHFLLRVSSFLSFTQYRNYTQLDLGFGLGFYICIY